MDEFPRSRLWILGLEVGQEVRVREMLKARRIVRHDVVVPRQVGSHGAVAVVPLESAVDEAKARASAGDCCSAFCHARDGWGVVAALNDGGISCVMFRGDDVELCDHASLFQVAVGDGAERVGC